MFFGGNNGLTAFFPEQIADRPYRPALGHAWACEELRREAGAQFDPKVVDAFLAEVEHVNEPSGYDHPIDEVTARLRELLAA